MIDVDAIPRPLLLDGGLATELEAQGHDLRHSLWSARLLAEAPQAIVDAHLAYLRAGANCIISASYQASLSGFMSLGMSEAEALDLLRLSVELARQAVDQHCEEVSPSFRPLVAASVGPYGAFLADGSEYRGDYSIGEQTLSDFHAPRLAQLIEAGPDLLACETVPCLVEAQVLARLVAHHQVPAWVSFSCSNGQLISSGEKISAAAKSLASNPWVFALGVNCSSPAHINALITEIRTHWSKRIVVYPNSGEHYDAQTHSWQGTTDPNSCADAALTWESSGADIIGGCCRMGPSHIQAIGTALAQATT